MKPLPVSDFEKIGLSKMPLSVITPSYLNLKKSKTLQMANKRNKTPFFSRCPIFYYPISFPGLGSETRARLFGEKEVAEQVKNMKLESSG